MTRTPKRRQKKINQVKRIWDVRCEKPRWGQAIGNVGSTTDHGIVYRLVMNCGLWILSWKGGAGGGGKVDRKGADIYLFSDFGRSKQNKQIGSYPR